MSGLSSSSSTTTSSSGRPGHSRSTPSAGAAGTTSSTSSRQRSRSRSRWPSLLRGPLSRQQLLLGLLALLAALHVAVAVNVVYDETGWTKREWHKYRIDFDLNAATDPAEEAALKSPELRKHLGEVKLNSLHGPTKRKPVSKFAGMWARDDGSLVASPSDDAVDQAAEAVMCTTCHSLVSHVWGQLVWAINHADPVSEGTVKELVEDACEAQVPVKVLSKYRIVQVEAPELDMALFVVRERKGTAAAAAAAAAASGSSDGSSDGQKQLPGSSGGGTTAKGAAPAAAAAAADKGSGEAGAAGGKDSSSSSSSSSGVEGSGLQGVLAGLPPGVTPAEVEAVQKACVDLATHHLSGLQKQVWPKAREFFNERLSLAQKVLSKALWYNDDSFWEPDAYEEEGEDDEYDTPPDTSLDMGAVKHKAGQKLTPADQLCLDMDVMCAHWAQQGQCTANPTYMVGDKKHIGHCKASCKACAPKSVWKQHPGVKSELRKAAAAAGQLLRTSVCSASRACMAAGSSTIGASVALKEQGSLLPGAVLAKTPGFVLGKPFWGRPIVREDTRGALTTKDRTTDPALQDPADEVLLSDGLGHKLLSIPGMDNFFMYQLEYKRRVYQFSQDKETHKVLEEHILGVYDPQATRDTVAKRDRLAASLNLDSTRAWQEQWRLQAAASKHSGAAGQQQQQQRQQQEEGGSGSVPAAPPMLELLDYLPDTEAMLASHWPYMLQMYTKGEACLVEGKSVERQVELRAACSPDGSTHLLVREPQFCSYIMVLYHPQLCDVDRLKPVPVLTSSSSSSKASSGSSKASGGSSKVSGGSSNKGPGSGSGSAAGVQGAGGSAKPAVAAAAAGRREGERAQGAGVVAGGAQPAPAAGGRSRPDSKADSSSSTPERKQEGDGSEAGKLSTS